jgi:diketogulonate reductase-like aldo/keto reductase
MNVWLTNSKGFARHACVAEFRRAPPRRLRPAAAPAAARPPRPAPPRLRRRRRAAAAAAALLAPPTHATAWVHSEMAEEGVAPKESHAKLANGVQMPVFGFGTAFGDWTSEAKGKAAFLPEQAWAAIPKALRAGVRHIDTAYVYRTHKHIGASLGAAFRGGELARDDIFITTKVGHPPIPGGGLLFGKTFDWDQNEPAIEEAALRDIITSLDELGVGYVDLVLVHWPSKFGGSDDVATNRKKRSAIWRALERAYELGMTRCAAPARDYTTISFVRTQSAVNMLFCRAIGVSNFTEVHLADLATDGATITPHVNQFEISPYTQYDKIMDYCRANAITMEAYSPLGSSAGGPLKDPVIVALAEKYSKNPGQIVLRWLVQQDIVVRSHIACHKCAALSGFRFCQR